jgi:hypothetical protein
MGKWAELDGDTPRGPVPQPATSAFHQRTARLGLRVDVSNIAETLDALDRAIRADEG